MLTLCLTKGGHSLTVAQIFAETLRHRKDRWGIFRSHISSRAKAQFTYLLSERSFRGRLLADHNGKLLDLQVRLGPFKPELDNKTDRIVRLSRTSQKTAPVVAQKHCPVVRNHFPRSVYCWRFGKPWDLLSGVWMNCMATLPLFLLLYEKLETSH